MIISHRRYGLSDFFGGDEGLTEAASAHDDGLRGINPFGSSCVDGTVPLVTPFLGQSPSIHISWTQYCWIRIVDAFQVGLDPLGGWAQFESHAAGVTMTQVGKRLDYAPRSNFLSSEKNALVSWRTRLSSRFISAISFFSAVGSRREHRRPWAPSPPSTPACGRPKNRSSTPRRRLESRAQKSPRPSPLRAGWTSKAGPRSTAPCRADA